MNENIVGTFAALRPLKRPLDKVVPSALVWLYRYADYIIMPTQLAIDMFNLDKVKVPVAPVSNGIDLALFHPGDGESVRRKFGIPPDKPVVFYMGRLDEEKHLSTILQAAPRILERVPDTQFVFGGGGNDEANLKSLAKKLGISDRVFLLGRISDEDKYLLERIASVYVMPSPAELQSVSTLEAMASGVPVVAANCGALPELCQDGRNGFLFTLDNAEELAEKVITILTDDKLQRKMARESLKIAKTHDIKSVIKQFEKIYRETIGIVNKRRTSPDRN
jgi:glycosyltransferase involved in cell wall biosynthesis